MGRLEPEKGYPALFRALLSARAQRPLRLLLLGEGVVCAELEALVPQLDLGDASLRALDPSAGIAGQAEPQARRLRNTMQR